MQKHIGTLIGTGSRVFVVFRHLPHNPKMSLVVYRDSLPEIFSYAVSRFIMEEGQNYVDLCDAMHQMGSMPTGENMLMALHTHGLLVEKPTDEVQMWLDERNSIRLDVLNDNLEAMKTNKATAEVTDFNPFDSAAEGTVLDDIISQIKTHEKNIKSLVERAKMLDETFEYGESQPQPQEPVEETDDLIIRISADDIISMSQSKFAELTKGIFREHKKRLNG